MKNKVLLFTITAFLNIGLYAQNAQQALQDIWREKTEWRQKAIEQHNQNHGVITSNEKSANDSNIVVSATADIQSEVHAAINPLDSNSIVVSSNYVNTTALIPTSTNYIYYTSNFGRTWAKSSFVTDPGIASTYVLGGGDPNFVFSDSGKAYFSWINLYSDQSFSNTMFNLYWASSVNGGSTWSRNNVSDIIGSAPSSITGAGGAFDKEWLAYDKNPASPFHGNLYCSFFQVDANTGEEYIGLRVKTETGVFDSVSTIVNSGTYKFLQFSSVAVDRSGNVHVSFFASVDSFTYSVYSAVSHDGGNSFQPEVKVSDVAIGRFSGFEPENGITGVDSTRLYPSAYIAADNSNGPDSNNVYMVWSGNGIDTILINGYDIYFSRSTDGGNTWSRPVILNDNSANLKTDQYYPAITVGSTGRVAVIWWDRRDDSANLKSNIYLTFSDNGGRTFARNVKVTSLTTDFSTVGNQNGGFGIGEYNTVLTTPGGGIIPIWADGRNNAGQLNLYAAFYYPSSPVDTFSPGPPPALSTGLQSIVAINGPLKIDALFPNPVKNQLTLGYETSEPGNMQLGVYDVQGKLVLPQKDVQVTAAKGTWPINVSALASGTYLVKVMFNGTVNVRQFVKTR